MSNTISTAGVALTTYRGLTRETRVKYGMNRIRAALYAGSIGIILFGIFAAVTSSFATGKLILPLLLKWCSL